MQEELYIAFENYLNNEMTSEEKVDFENKLQNQESFKKQFELYKETTQFLEVKFSNDTIDFKENLKSISKDHFSDTNKKKSKVISLQSKWFAIAATLVVFVGVWFMNSGGNPTYSDFNQHENANFTERGSVIKDLKAAQEAFNDKNYEKAIPLFEKVLEEYKRPEIEFYYGISLLEVNKTAQAEVVFNNLKDGKSVYNQKATWYLALTKLKVEDFEACKTYLKEISSDSEDFEKAQELLNELD
ncbi:tetratricopeptide repeat protein [Flavobacterium gelidilacus]|jgi:tetratricopeptide (TPR) repeat protein|uniref:tetratricopeptide repeat protein n=1 Tax=Flavobacterium gelidilacus TaxID=206041 RepID=UPI00041758EF|nr:tetratricopeptide repeat protein [Flavobacterium gelidilacus]